MIPPKIVKISAYVIDSHLANIKNNDITKNVFSQKAKVASVRPIFKKNELEKNWKLQACKHFKLFFKGLWKVSSWKI